MELGKINIKSKYSVIEWFRVCLGWRKSITLNLRPYSGKTTLEICHLVNSGVVLKSKETNELMTVIDGNLAGYVDMIVTACAVPSYLTKQVASGIVETWTVEQIKAAVGQVYQNIDFQSALEIMSIMGQIRFDD
ncbi:hypothetical protein [Sphingobacterium sp. UBA7038]|uniref:hypothetical protein n=1 Tax=Sphingobacterium TaxID=28453 RepID=UPI000EE32BE6|nr:hypothetical protein [Sphingobacterium sp. UBA7038]HAF34557.1 hypothetical protein [Sphingobacterium sp.]